MSDCANGSTKMSENCEMKKKFDSLATDIIKNKKQNCVYLSSEQYCKIIDEVSSAKSKTKNKTVIDYRRLQRYDLINIGKESKLILPLTETNTSVKYFVCNEEIFDVIHAAHLNVGHGGRNKMTKKINEKYTNITIEMIMLYLSLCETCQKKSKCKERGIVMKPILAAEFNSRCQVDLIDLQTQADGDYKFILNYQDHLTKFVILRPLKTKTPSEVAKHLMDIFTTFGAPSILHSDNGREFVNKVINELTKLWDDVKIIHGKPRLSETQGSVERENQDVQNILATCMDTKKTTKWSEELKFVQMIKNRSYHDGIKQTPYEALFGSKMKLGLRTSNFPEETINSLQCEEELEKIINEATLEIREEAISSIHPQGDLEDVKNIAALETQNETISSIHSEEDLEDVKNIATSGTQNETISSIHSQEDLEEIVKNVILETHDEGISSFQSERDIPLNIDKVPIFTVTDDLLRQEVTTKQYIKNETSNSGQADEDGDLKDETFLESTRALISKKRKKALNSPELQANKMLKLSNQKFLPATVGDSVKVPIPDLDRGQTNPKNLIATIISVDNGYYILGTKEGRLKQHFTRNQFTVCRQKFLLPNEVPEGEKTLSEIVSLQSLTGG